MVQTRRNSAVGDASLASGVSVDSSPLNEDNDRRKLIAPPSTPKKMRKTPPAICTLCSATFPSRPLFDLHFTTCHQAELPYSCSHCSKGFAVPRYLKKHELIHNPDGFKGPPQFQCNRCDKRYHLKCSLESHIKSIHRGIKPRYKTIKEPILHHQSTKGTKNPNPHRKPVEVHQCPFCEKIFNYRIQLFEHITYHIKERPYNCSVCQQSFSHRLILRNHILKIHKTPNPRVIPGQWQAGQPCRCSICGLDFKAPSILKGHMRIHSGEKPYNCDICDKRFRMASNLKLHLVTHMPPDTEGLRSYKCQVCGKEGFRRFCELRQHRAKVHRHIPVIGEKEKPFGCGVCGKPFYLRNQAIICALLGHDPGYLQKQMFRRKCPECPKERFGFHHLAYLQRHWEDEHKGKVLPVELTNGIYCDKFPPDIFPKVAIDKKKAKQIRIYGPPKGYYDFPLFVEFPLLPMSDQERHRKWRVGRPGRKKGEEPKIIKCSICNVNYSRVANLRKHLRVVHDRNKIPKKLKILKCKFCDNKYTRITHLWHHQIKEHHVGGSRPTKKDLPVSSSVLQIGDLVIKEEPVDLDPASDDEEDEEDHVINKFKCEFCERKFVSFKGKRVHEGILHLKKLKKVNCRKPKKKTSLIITGHHQWKSKSVNVNDSEAVFSLLGNQVVQVRVYRLKI